jgi:AcrR family transcriptional regulator
MSTGKRPYRSESREAQAEQTRKRILIAAKRAFSRRGFDHATIREIAAIAGVSAPLVYALFKSKAGLLRALIDSTVFGTDYQALVENAVGEQDPVEILRTAASITRLIYDAERRHMGSIHRPGILSTALRRFEQGRRGCPPWFRVRRGARQPVEPHVSRVVPVAGGRAKVDRRRL